MVKPYQYNARHLENELQWLADVIRQRYVCHRDNKKPDLDIEDLTAPDLSAFDSIYKTVVIECNRINAVRIVLLLALIPNIRPFFLDDITNALVNSSAENAWPAKAGTVPTIDLALFILAGDNLEKRFYYQQMFSPGTFLIQNGILIIDCDSAHEIQLQQPLKISPEYLSLLTVGKPYKPGFSMAFPAKRIETGLDWSDLVLSNSTLEQVNEINLWIRHSKTLLHEWGLEKRLAPGYKVLFYGPPGTGKTFTASLIGKQTGFDVYRIDLSMVISKYIGETEKNLSGIFNAASDKEWILFFDEADALFGKRSDLKDSHDRYANQEVAYLLQKIEEHNGVVILSSNMRSNIDDAFTRRFQNVIHFAMPTAAERLQIWQQAFSIKTVLAGNVNLEYVAAQYELSGGAIMNVIRYASLKALEQSSNIIQMHDIVKGIRREYNKEGRTV